MRRRYAHWDQIKIAKTYWILIADVCAVRLDFDSFTTMGPATTEETTGGACTDSFVITGTSGLSSPTICGKNTGQHRKHFLLAFYSKRFRNRTPCQACGLGSLEPKLGSRAHKKQAQAGSKLGKNRPK